MAPGLASHRTLMAGDIETAFHEAMLGAYNTAKTECGYNATYFFQMVSEHGGLAAAKQLLSKPGFSDGLTTLWELGRLDISMEALVLKEPWFPLFNEEELNIARMRLKELGYPV